MEKKEKLTLAQLIDRKEQIAARKKQTSELYIQGLGGTVTVQTPSPSLIADSFNMPDDQGDKYLVFRSVIDPCLADSGLMEAYGAADPITLIDQLFMPGEISAIAAECMCLAGYRKGDVSPVEQTEKIKN